MNTSFTSYNINTSYRYFVDQPPFAYYTGAHHDFGTYCCNYDPKYGTLAVLRQNLPSAVAPAFPHVQSSLPVGIPAIHATKKAAATVAAIAQSDVVTFAQHTPMPYTISPVGNPSVRQARILTSKQISELLQGETTGFPDAHSLWFVELNGTFNFPNSDYSPCVERRGF